MNALGRCPKCQSAEVHVHGSVRAGDRALAVGHSCAGVFRVFSPLDAYSCLSCGYAEHYRKMG